MSAHLPQQPTSKSATSSSRNHGRGRGATRHGQTVEARRVCLPADMSASMILGRAHPNAGSLFGSIWGTSFCHRHGRTGHSAKPSPRALIVQNVEGVRANDMITGETHIGVHVASQDRQEPFRRSPYDTTGSKAERSDLEMLSGPVVLVDAIGRDTRRAGPFEGDRRKAF